jgi:hypothetical protein
MAEPATAPRWCLPAVAGAAVIGLVLMSAQAWAQSATYDEVTYLKVGARWWRTGAQDEITRMGSPLIFWKLQQAPVLALLDATGRGLLIDAPEEHQAELLPLVRVGALWVWLGALAATAIWAREIYGPRAMACAAWLFALSPNLLAHGGLVTMELPLVAASTVAFWLFGRFLERGRRADFWGSAAAAGLAFACKFTAVLWPVILGATWWAATLDPRRPGAVGRTARVAVGIAGFVVVMGLVDLAVTAGARIPLSHTSGGSHPSLGPLARWPALGRLAARVVETPLPQDLVGFATQAHHQRSGGPSYLLGARRTTGWWYYYFVCLAVKVPLAFWALAAARASMIGKGSQPLRDWYVPAIVLLFLTVTALGSTRNYGYRYLLPLAPLGVVWVSGLAERTGWRRIVVVAGLVGQVAAVGSVFPAELTYFNALAGGRVGGRRILADSNLDWGQGLVGLARLQRERPELCDLTLYYFGDTEPRHYGLAGTSHVLDAIGGRSGLPKAFEATTRFVAVSASLQFGPWGPEGYFRALDGARPEAYTEDTTIAVYRTSDVFDPDRPANGATAHRETLNELTRTRATP